MPKNPCTVIACWSCCCLTNGLHILKGNIKISEEHIRCEQCRVGSRVAGEVHKLREPIRMYRVVSPNAIYLIGKPCFIERWGCCGDGNGRSACRGTWERCWAC